MLERESFPSHQHLLLLAFRWSPFTKMSRKPATMRYTNQSWVTSTSLLHSTVDVKVGGSIEILLLSLWLLVDPRSGKMIRGCSLQVRTVVLLIFWIEKIGGGSKIDGLLIDWRNDKPFGIIRTRWKKWYWEFFKSRYRRIEGFLISGK